MIALKTYIFLFALLISIKSSVGQPLSFEYYQELNNKETRLAEYKDSDVILKLKLQQLAIINKSRRKHKVSELDFDILSARVANQIADEAAQNKYMGHWNMAGEKPWMRYANAGGQHHMTENASSISSNGKLAMQNDDILSYMKSCHDAFMAERKPNDGHKQNCIAPFHTHVGIGIAWRDGEFRYYENFLDNYLEFENFNQICQLNKESSLNFKLRNDQLHLFSIVVYYEPVPKPMSPRNISRRSEYPDYSDNIFLQLAPWELPQIKSDGSYDLSFIPVKKGYYYCQIFLSEKPYKKGTASTKGKLQASGIAIKVE